MASTTANCGYCGTAFTGYGETRADAQRDAQAQAGSHQSACPANPDNQEKK